MKTPKITSLKAPLAAGMFEGIPFTNAYPSAANAMASRAVIGTPNLSDLTISHWEANFRHSLLQNSLFNAPPPAIIRLEIFPSGKTNFSMERAIESTVKSSNVDIKSVFEIRGESFSRMLSRRAVPNLSLPLDFGGGAAMKVSCIRE